MADPVWTVEYNFSNTPEQNGFTRVITGSPVVTEVTTGKPADRRLDIDTSLNGGAAVFITSSIPSLDPTVGATLEMLASVSGDDSVGYHNAGVELTFADRTISFSGRQDELYVLICGSDETVISTSLNNTDIRWRVTFEPGVGMRVYRNTVLVFGPTIVNTCTSRFQRVLFWSEGGAIASFKEMKYYIGGPVVP